MKRTLLILTPLLVLMALAAVALHMATPTIESWARVQIHELSQKYLPVDIDVENISLSLLPPAVTVTGIEVEPKDEKAMGFSYLTVDALEADLDLLQLFVGKIAISTLTIEHPEIDMDLDPLLAPGAHVPHKEENNAAHFTLNNFFDHLKVLPMHRLFINHLESNIEAGKYKASANIVDANLLAVNELQALVIETEIPIDNIQWDGLKDAAYIRATMSLRPQSLDIARLHATFDATDVVVTGVLDDLQNLPSKIKGNLEVESKTDLQKIQKILASKVKLPDLLGSVNTNLKIDLNDQKIQSVQIGIQANQVSIADYAIGDLNLQGVYTKNLFSFSKFQITDEALVAELPSLALGLDFEGPKPRVTLSTDIHAQMFDLNELLKLLKVGDIPIELITAGNFKCAGPLYPDFDMNCSGEANADGFEARGGGDDIDHTIVQIRDFKAKGDVEITTQAVKYTGNLEIGNNSGTSAGVIDFKNGFAITYNTPNVDFENLAHLAGLKLEGTAALSGKIVGTSKWAEFFIDADAKNLWFEDFFLGNGKTHVTYKKGLLGFNNLTGNIRSSQYNGDVAVDLTKSRIRLNVASRELDVQDGLTALKRKFVLPVDAEGTFNLKATAEGPLALGELSYDLIGQLSHGSVAGENIESGKINIHSESGHVQSREFSFVKGHNTIVGEGTADPHGIVHFKLSGDPVMLEDFDNLSRLNSNIYGQLFFTFKADGFILKPEMTLSMHTQNVTIEEQELANSEATFHIDDKSFKGDVKLLSGKLTSSFEQPYSDINPFHFEASARDWNYTTLFTLVGGGPILSEYKSSLTGDIRLHADKGGLFKADGQGTILKSSLQRGSVVISNPGPMNFTMNHGRMTLENFRMAGEDSYLEMDSPGSTKENMNLKLLGKIDLHLIQIFFPFLEDLKGVATVKMNLLGALEHPDILGSGSVQDALIKLKSLPHPFEKINANAQFSLKKVVVSDINGLFAGGTIDGDGTMSINGPSDIPMLFHFDLDNIALNMPDKVKTYGSAEMELSGNWFPFMLSGTYHVQGGTITKEFGGDTSESTAKQSSYLPKALLQSTFSPIELDIKAVLEQPLAVKNSLVDGNATGSLQIQGTPDNPILLGKIALTKGSKLSIRDKMFEINACNLNFNNNKEINPEIYLSGNTRVADYDINLIVQGTAKEPVTKFSSVPPLPDPDIVSLLALGMTTGNVDKGTAVVQKDQQQNMNTQLGAAVISTISKDAQKALDVDIQVSSQYDDTKNMSTQKYVIRRKVSDKLTFSGEVTRGDQSETTYKLKYSINPSVSISTSLENMDPGATNTSMEPQSQGQVLGVDLEYKKEFK